MDKRQHEDPDEIYLEPMPPGPEGRLWCQDDVWPVDAADDRDGGVRYIRADLVETGEVKNRSSEDTT